MHRTPFLIFISSAGLFSASADPLIAKMRALSDEGPLYAYEMSYSSGSIEATGRIDPILPVGERVHVLSPSEDEWSGELLAAIEEMESDTDGDIWCNDFAQMVSEDVSLASETDSTATYKFTPSAEPDADKSERKMMRKMQGLLTLDKSDGAILGINIVLPKPYKPAMVAKIETFKLDASCARAPDGRTFLEALDFRLKGSAMMQEFDEGYKQTISNLMPPQGG